MPMFFRTYHRPAPPAFHPYGGLLPFLSLLDINDDDETPCHPCGPNKSAQGCEEERSRGCGARRMRGRGWGPHSRSFTPNFNVVETEQSFELEGELPGLSNRDNVTVEWQDGQTLVVSGRIDRRTPPQTDDENEDTNMQDGAAEKQLQASAAEAEEEKTTEKQVTFRDAAEVDAEHDELEESVFISRPTTPGAREALPSYQATVEDEGTPDTITDEKTPLTTEEKGKGVAKPDDDNKDGEKKGRHCHGGPGAWRGRCGGPGMWARRGGGPGPWAGPWAGRGGWQGPWGRRCGGGEDRSGKKFLAHERFAVGEFTRSFKFGANIVDHEAVSATLKDGILKIVVPKKAPLGVRRVDIQ